MYLQISFFLYICGSLAVGCSGVNDANTPETLVPESAVIEQIGSHIEGQKGQNVIFHLSDYFASKSPIRSVQFYSDSVTVQPVENDSYRVSQPNHLSGEYGIEVILINEMDQKLESQLTYVIKHEEDRGEEDSGEEDSGEEDSGEEDSGEEDSGEEDSGEEDSENEPETDLPTSDGTLVLMPLGDSMTNDSRPRVTLWNLLADDGHELDYVGDQRQTSSIPDPDHEGVGGIKIQGIMDKAEHLMNTHKPQFVLLMVGTNDIAWYFDETGQSIANRWNELIQLLFDTSEPGTYIIAATIPPVSSRIVGKETLDERDRSVLVKEFNAAIRRHIANRRDNGEKIILADMEAVLEPAEHLSGDGVHLNDEGYRIMGTVYYEAVNTALSDL